MERLGLLALIPFLRSATTSLFLAAILGAALGATRGIVLLRGGVIIVLCLWFGVAFTTLSDRIAQPLKVAQLPETADAVVVLHAGIQKDNDFGAATLERTLHGLELVQQGYAPRLILTEVPPPDGSHAKAASALMKNLSIRGQLLSVGPVQNTHDEAVLVSALTKQHGWKKILLVTAPTHSRRAFFTFAKTGLQVVSTPCQETSFDFENLAAEGVDVHVRAFAEAIREIVGLRIYRARGWA